MQMACENALHKREYVVRRRGPSGDISSNLMLTLTQDIDSRLKIVLSDPLDPSFLCVLVITQSDYDEIKKTQGLLVDFDNFPAQFIRLLQQCESGNMFLYLHQQGPSNIFVEIIERNDFKRLVHLSLKTGPASDADIKRNMAENILLLQKNLANITSTLHSKETMFQEKENFLETRINDLGITLSKLNKEKNVKEMEYQELLSKEKERLDQDKQEWQKNIELHYKNKNNTMQDILSRKEKQLEEASVRCRQFQDTVKSLESQIMDKTQRIFALEKQVHIVKSDADAFKNQNEMLDKNMSDKDQNLQTIKFKLKDTQKALKEKSEVLRDTLDALQNLKMEKNNLEEKVHQNEKLSTQHQTELQNINADLTKANEIIFKQNNIILDLKEKVRKRTAIVLEQEKIVENNSKEITKLTENEKKLFDQVSQNDKTIEELTRQNELYKLDIEIKNDTIKKNNTVIQWLQAKLDAAQSIKETAGSSHSAQSLTNKHFTPFSSDSVEKPEDNQDRLSDLYTAEISSRKSTRSNISSTKQCQEFDEEFSIDPVYLQPSSYNSKRTLTGRKSQDSLSKSSTVSNVGSMNKENRKIDSGKSKKENRYVKSATSAYFP